MQFNRFLVAALVISGLVMAAVPAEARRVYDRYHRRYVDVGSRRWHYGPRGDIIFGAAVAATVANAISPGPATVVVPAASTNSYVVYDYDPFYSNTTYVYRDRSGYRYYYDRRGRVVGRVGTRYVRHGRHHHWRR